MAIKDAINKVGNVHGSTILTAINQITGEHASTIEEAVKSLVAGYGNGGGGSVADDVKLYDYDGTILYKYAKDEFLALSTLPDIPSHNKLVVQGWNYSLADAKEYVEAYGKLNIGATYVTSSGATELDVKLLDDILELSLSIAINGSVTIDWGDGSATSTATGSSLETLVATTHTYSEAGEYTISITVNIGEIAIIRDANNYTSIIVGDTDRHWASLKAVRIGNGVTSISDGAFSACYSLASVTIPSSVTSISDGAFSACYSLTSVTIPSSVTSIGMAAFDSCSSLASVTIPSSVTSIGESAFGGCSSLASVTIPSSVTSIGMAAFSSCYSLASVTIPSSVTSIGESAFGGCRSLTSVTIPSSVTSIGGYAFDGCYSLASVTIPSSVTSIGDDVFNQCYSLPLNFGNDESDG